MIVKELKEKGGIFGFNADTEKTEDMLKAGIIDPAKVTKPALQNAASIAGLMLTTEALVSEIKEKDKAAGRRRHAGGMGDWIAADLTRLVPSARLVRELSNRGFGAACNRGARESSRAYLLFLNSDAFVRPGAVARLVSALEADPGAAAAGPRLSHPDGRLQGSIRRLPSPWRIFCESLGLAFLRAGGRRFPATPRPARITRGFAAWRR